MVPRLRVVPRFSHGSSARVKSVEITSCEKMRREEGGDLHALAHSIPEKNEGLLLVYVVPENIHTHPKEGNWKFREGGSQKPNILKESTELQVGGGMDTFWNYTLI